MRKQYFRAFQATSLYQIILVYNPKYVVYLCFKIVIILYKYVYMSTITIEQRKQIILIISYIILIHFKIKVSCVCSKLPSPVAVFFKSLHLH